MSKRRLFIPAIALGLLLACPAKKALCAKDPWYSDMRKHWAEPYVRVLWEESVTDGYLSSIDASVCRYWPNEYATRAQLAVLLFRVFDLPPAFPSSPTYPDVPKNYNLFWNVPGWHLIEGAYAGGIIFVTPGQIFSPADMITREDAVELLIRSLSLSDYAASIPETQRDQILRRFWDYNRISAARRASMACAVQLGILKGYDDGSIQPCSLLSRGEAATVVARSCLIRMRSRLDMFSPDGDGVDDQAVFDLTYLKNRGIAKWQAAIEDSQGAVVRYLGTPNTPGLPPAALTWNGSRAGGEWVPIGTYYYQAMVTDWSGRQFQSVRMPIMLTRHSLSAWVQPSACPDGATLTVGASTQPPASGVSATFADGVTRALAGDSTKTRWQLSFAMGPFLPVGPQEVTLHATFQRAERSATVTFSRVSEMWLDPAVIPNPAAWGQTLALTCVAPDPVTSVEASLFGETIALSKEAGLWTATAEVPFGISIGIYPVQFTARSPSESKSATVMLAVEGPDVTGLAYILTK